MDNINHEESLKDNGPNNAIESHNPMKSNLPLSKRQLKKLKRDQEWEIKKQALKQQRKEKDKLKKQKKREEDQNLKKTNPELYEELHPTQIVPNPPRKEMKKKYLENIRKGIIIIVDCGFEKHMNDKDLISLTRQITDCYSMNRKSEKPFNLIIYDVGPKIKHHLLKNNCQKWLGFRFIEEGRFENIKDFIAKEFSTKNSENTSDGANLNLNSDDHLVPNDQTFYNMEEISKSENIIYLTGDSENEICDLSPNKVYIIGGLVDRNRLKLITYDKANEIGISHARLPIGDFLILKKSSKILATNHVFGILSYFVNKNNDWNESFTSIIPKRKIEEEGEEEQADDC